MALSYFTANTMFVQSKATQRFNAITVIPAQPQYGITSGRHTTLLLKQGRKITAPSNKKLADLCKKYNISKEAIRTEVLKAVLDRRVLSEALVDLIVSNNLPFRAVEWPAIHHTLLKACNPAIDREVISSHSEVSTKIHSLFDSSLLQRHFTEAPPVGHV
ncbi:hypothetical protein V8E54_005027 [Elaphomyces granulatus]|jgi:hypothetical protein